MVPDSLQELLVVIGLFGGAVASLATIWRLWVRPVILALRDFFKDVKGLRLLLEEDVLKRLQTTEEEITLLRKKIESRDERFAGVLEDLKFIKTRVGENHGDTVREMREDG